MNTEETAIAEISRVTRKTEEVKSSALQETAHAKFKLVPWTSVTRSRATAARLDVIAAAKS